MNPLHSQVMGTKLLGSNAAPEIPLPKNLSRKIARFFVSKISRATGVKAISHNGAGNGFVKLVQNNDVPVGFEK